MSRRTERVASLIRRIIAESIQGDLADPRIPTLTSVTRVEVTADMSLATVYVSVLSERTNAADRTLEALTAASGRMRARLAEALTMRKVPALRFRFDESVQGAMQTIQVIDALNRERAARAAAAAPHEAESTSDGPQRPSEDQ